MVVYVIRGALAKIVRSRWQLDWSSLFGMKAFEPQEEDTDDCDGI